MKKALISGLLLIVVLSNHAKIYAQYDLKFNPKIGKTYPMQMSVNLDMRFVISENELSMKQKMILGYTFYIDSKDEDNTYLITTINRNISHEFDMMGNKVSFNSSDPQNSTNPMARLYMALIDKPYQMEIGEDGEIKDILKLDKIYEEMFDSLSSDEELMKTNFMGQFGKEYFKSTFDTFFNIFPSKTVDIGETWTNEVLMINPFEMVHKTKYKLVSVSNDTAFIDVDTKITVNPDSEFIKMGNSEFKIMMQGTQKGTILVDMNTGWMIRSQTKQEISGQMRMPGNEQEEKPTAWPIRMESEIIYEPYDL